MVVLVKAMVLPVVKYGWKRWTIKRAEHCRVDALNCGVGKDCESHLGCKEIQPFNPKGNQSWSFIERTDAEAQSDLSIDHMMMSMCRGVSCCWKRVFAMTSVLCLGKTLLIFALLCFVLQGQSCLLLQVSLTFLFLDFSPLWWKGHIFFVLLLEGLVGLQIQLPCYYWLGHILELLWFWMVWLWNRRIFLSFLRLHPNFAFWTLVDYEGYCISLSAAFPQ